MLPASLSSLGVVHLVTQVVAREDGLFSDATDVAVFGEEQFNFDALHRGGLFDVEQCVDEF